jgi:hypothetical protein
MYNVGDLVVIVSQEWKDEYPGSEYHNIPEKVMCKVVQVEPLTRGYPQFVVRVVDKDARNKGARYGHTQFVHDYHIAPLTVTNKSYSIFLDKSY